MEKSSVGRTLNLLCRVCVCVCVCVFIDKLLFWLNPLSERELASIRHDMKSERNQDTRVMESRIECNVLKKKRRVLLLGVKMKLLPVQNPASQTYGNFVR
jgi:hypothetical protein